MKNSDDNIIYIGKSKSLRNRVKSYFKDKYDTPKTKILMSHFSSLEYIITDSEKEALILEANLIKKNIDLNIILGLRMIKGILMLK